jgi:hypothetical protein
LPNEQKIAARVQEYYEASAADGGISLTTTFGDEPLIAELDSTLLQRP